MRTLYSVPALLLALAALPAHADAQESGPDAGHASHGRTFHPGGGTGWTLGYPSVDVNAGEWFTSSGPGSSIHHFFLRAHVGMNTGIPHLALSGDLNWIPSLGATPVFSVVGQVDPLDRASPFYLSVGAGLVTGHSPGADRFVGWAQAVLAFRTPIHELAPFVQVGRALQTGAKLEVLVGLAHPLAPYQFHVP
ncbi:MAG TPA: hypothetical protein VI160_05905 [Gemmatimonadales bacterium]